MPQKILLVRFSSIGDIVLTTPVLRCLKEQVSDVEIHYITKSKYLYLLNHNPYISKIFTFQKSLHEVIPQLKQERYDNIIDLHNNLRSFRLKLKLLKPSSSYRKLNFKKWLLVHFKINLLPDTHIVERYMHTLRQLNVSYDEQGLDFFFSSDVGLPEQCEAFVNRHPEYCVIAIGGTYFTKRCPSEKVTEIVKRLGIPTILTGSELEIPEAEKIHNLLPELTLNACGYISVYQSALLMKKAEFVISNDTGMMHIAAALKKPVISLWGNTVPQFGMTPLLPASFPKKAAIIENISLTCRPCSKLGFDKCPKQHFRCMNELNIDDISDYVKEL